MNLILARKLQDDSRLLKKYSNLLLKAVQQKYLKEDIDDFEFSNMVNLISIIDFKTREIDFDVRSYVTDLDRKYRVYDPKIDIRV